MLTKEEFIRFSIDINLFFQRIMKEHLFFIETNLQTKEVSFVARARAFKHSFEELLTETVNYAPGLVSKATIDSNEIVTPYTLKAEELNSLLTGAAINTEITKSEYKLADDNRQYKEIMEEIIMDLNQRSLILTGEAIKFQKQLLSLNSECKIFMTLYDAMLNHDIKEAEYYYEILKSLESKTVPKKTLCEELNFWNYVMKNHAQFIDGLLDPTEKPLKETAETIAKRFENLIEECINTAENQIIQNSLIETETIKGFKQASTEGLLNCKIKSIIPPLLADHVLREANHYLKLLKLNQIK